MGPANLDNMIGPKPTRQAQHLLSPFFRLSVVDEMIRAERTKPL
jgi:hypothetical protein